MEAGMLVAMTVILGVLLLLIQRSEKRRRRVVFILLLPVIAVVFWYASNRDYMAEAVTSMILALILNGLFWILIGRYNPVGSSDSIKVLGLDD